MILPSLVFPGFMLARVRACFMHEREGENEGVRVRVRKSLECERALCLQGCPHHRDKRSLLRTLSSSVRERERGREGEGRQLWRQTEKEKNNIHKDKTKRQTYKHKTEIDIQTDGAIDGQR